MARTFRFSNKEEKNTKNLKKVEHKKERKFSKTLIKVGKFDTLVETSF